MERVLGIGGIFFRANNPEKLSQWYQDHLGIGPLAKNYGDPSWTTEAGPTEFCPFTADTDYFGRETQQWMLNFRVKNLAAMVAQLQAAGIGVHIDEEEYPNGRFARIYDPEGNPVELWEPK